MEYIIHIQTDFGELKVYFETEGILKSWEEVLDIALEKIRESNDISLKKPVIDDRLLFEISEGETLEDM